MKKKILTTFFLLIFNLNLFADEDNKSIRIGLLAPLTGTYSELGNSLLFSLQLALEEIARQRGGVELQLPGLDAGADRIERRKKSN